MRRHPGLVDRKFDLAIAGVDALQLGAVHAVLGQPVNAVAVPVGMAMRMAVTAAGLAHVQKRSDGDPAAETDQGEAGQRVHHAAELLGGGDAGHPDDDGDEQGRQDVAGPGQQGGAGGLNDRPAALTGDEGDRDPVIGNHGVEHADPGHGGDEQQFGIAQGHGRPG